MKKTYKALLCGAAAVAAVGIAYAMDERFFEKAKDKLTVFKCRANSKIMEQALPLTDAMFPGPKVVSGADSAKKIPEVLKELNVNKVMIVTGPTVGRTIVPPIAENLERHGIGYTIYDQVEANPSVKTVEAIRAQYLENGCDGFLAIGGGWSWPGGRRTTCSARSPNAARPPAGRARSSPATRTASSSSRTPPMSAMSRPAWARRRRSNRRQKSSAPSTASTPST